MTTKEKVLRLLDERMEQWVSGEELAEKLEVSRTAVWKQIAALQKDGYTILSETGKVYRLQPGEVLSAYEIEKRLTTRVIGRPVVYFDSVNSTNLYAKNTPSLSDGTMVVTSHQTAGVGRLARRFYSPDRAGVYLSILLRPETVAVADISTITLMTAVAVADTVEEFSGVRPQIKWTNDIYLNRRKLCGILTEASIEGESGMIRNIIVGIGINLFQRHEDFEPEIRDIAGSVFSETGIRIHPAAYAARLAANFERYYLDGHFPANKASFLQKYREGLFFLGETVEVRSVKGNYFAVAEDIDEDGNLIVRREDGSRAALNSGEISLKLQR